jgi:hypothetical protein
MTTFIRKRTSPMYPSSVPISSSKILRRCSDRSIASWSAVITFSAKVLSSDIRCPRIDVMLLLSVLERPREWSACVRDRATALTLARLALALRTAETNLNEDLEED